MTFAEASAVRPLGDGTFEAEFDESWFQGAGLFGGLAAAALVRAMSVGIGRPLRSFSAQFCAPVTAGRALVEVRVERAGGSATFVSSRLVQDGVRMHAMAMFGGDRPNALDEALEVRPEAPPAASLPRLVWQAPLPVFLQHVDMRLFRGPPYAGADTSGVGGWILTDEPVDEALVVLLLDVMPPAALTRARDFRPMSSVTWSVHLTGPVPPRETTGAWMVDAQSRTTVAGWSDETDRLFSPDGRLVAYGRQLRAVLR